MSDKSIAAIATTGTDQIRFTLSASIATARSCCGTSCCARRNAAVPDRMEAWVGTCLQLQALGHDREWLANQICARV
jgi:hypothetical protein